MLKKVKFLKVHSFEDGETFQIGDLAEVDLETFEALKTQRIVEEIPEKARDSKRSVSRVSDAEPSDSQKTDQKADLKSSEIVELVTKTVAETLEKAQIDLSQGTDHPKISFIRDRAVDRPFKSLGEQLVAVINAGSGKTPDPRLLRLKAPAGMSEGVASEGGWLVQSDLAAGLFRTVMQTGVLAPRCRSVPLGPTSNALRMNAVDETSRATGSRWGGIAAYWLAEGETVTETKVKFRQMETRLKKLIGAMPLTDELLQDTTALAGLVELAFTEEFRFMFDDAVFRGTGAGDPLGAMNAPCAVTVLKEGGQAADTINSMNILKMFSRMAAGSLPNAIWTVNSDCFPQLASMTITGAGGLTEFPVYLPPNGFSQAPYGTLFNRPVFPIEQASTLGDLGDIAFCDYTQYLLVTKGGVEAAESIHVYFLSDQSVLRFIVRLGGQPLWNSALTPAHGSNTVSPFIFLQERA